MQIRDLSAPVTASKADWLSASTWLGFTPSDDTLQSRNTCQSTIQRQFGQGYVLEYITKSFSQPNPGFENDPGYLEERRRHEEKAGRLIAVHRLRTTSRRLEEILGPDEFKHLQDMWAVADKRCRWSVAFPIVESYHVIGAPHAHDVFPPADYVALYQRPSAVLRILTPEHQKAIADLPLEPVKAENAWIGIEDEFQLAELSQINPSTLRNITVDLPDAAMEGMTEERRTKVRRRAAWLADKFVLMRQRSNTLTCDACSFDPAQRPDLLQFRQRTFFDVHHKHPLDEGVRYTTTADFSLLCPTCHRIEHLFIAQRRGST